MKKLLKNLILIIFAAVTLASCGITKKVVDVEKVVTTYRDSTIYNVRDSIVWTPKEYYRDYASMLDTLTISGDFSEFRAWNDTSLHLVTGTAKIEPKIEEKWHTVYQDRIVERTDTVYVEKTIERPVEVVKYRVPGWAWFLLALFLSIIGYKLYKIFKL